MTFYFNGSRSPSNLYVYDFATKQVRKLTESLNPEIDPADLVESKVIRYKSFDGMVIPSILYKPIRRAPRRKRRRCFLFTEVRRPDSNRLQRSDSVSGQSRLRGSWRQQP